MKVFAVIEFPARLLLVAGSRQLQQNLGDRGEGSLPLFLRGKELPLFVLHASRDRGT